MTIHAEHASIMQASMAQLVRQAASRWPDRTALVFDEDSVALSFSELDAESDKACQSLIAIGVEPGQRVGVMLRNRAEFPIAWLALMKLGAAMVPLNTHYKENDASHVIRHSGISTIITEHRFLPILERVIQGHHATTTRIVSVDEGGEAGLLNLDSVGHAEGAQDISAVFPETVANIQYTSGTTGHPKGCVLSQYYWTRMGRIVATTPPGITDADTLLTAQPFYYMDPQWNLAVALTTGAKLVVLDRFHPSTFWERIRYHKVTFFYCLGMMPPALLRMPEGPLDRDHSVRFVTCSAIPKALHAALEERWGVPWYEAFGMTETGSATRLLPADHETNIGHGCIGRPSRDREVRVLDPAGDVVSRGENGELVLRGPGMMDEYLDDPSATESVFRNGWFHTGDIVRQAPDGLIYYLGRTKDSIRRSGENISAAEVEQVLMQHPAVAVVACVPVPDDLRGEEVKAYLVLAGSDEAATPERLHEWCLERLAYFKVPRFWQFVSDVPRTPSERVAKAELVRGVEDLRKGAFDAVSKKWL